MGYMATGVDDSDEERGRSTNSLSRAQTKEGNSGEVVTDKSSGREKQIFSCKGASNDLI